MTTHLISVENIAALKSLKAEVDSVIITLGQSTKGDNKGALYYYDPTDTTTAEDTIYYNVVSSTVSPGRWKKVFTRTIALPHGTLVINAGVKSFYCNATTNSSSEATINLTLNNTPTGIAIFSEIWFDDSKATVNTSTSNNAVSGCRKSLATDLKTLTHLFYKGNSSILSAGVLTSGVTVLGFQGSGTGVPVSFKIEGV